MCDALAGFSLSVNYVQVIQKKDQTRVAQAKILIVLVDYIILGISALTSYSLASRQFSRFLDELQKYFICESAGTGEVCDRSGFMEYNNPASSAISFILLGIVSMVNLLYVMKFQSVRETCLRWCGRTKKPTSGLNSRSSTLKSTLKGTKVLRMSRLN